MKYIFKKICIGLLISLPYIFSSNTSVKSQFVPMSIGSNLNRQYHKVIAIDEESDKSYSVDFNVTYSYNRSFKESNIANMIFNASTLSFQGADVSNRSDNALIAEYFGMGSLTNAKVDIKPLLQNHLIDLQLALGGESLWAQVNVPLVYACNTIRGFSRGKIDTNFSTSGTTNINLANETNNISVGGVDINSVQVFNQEIGKTCDIQGDLIDEAVNLQETGLSRYAALSFTTASNEVISLTNKAQIFIASQEALALAEEYTIVSPVVKAALSLQQALKGYTFGNLKERNYGLIQLNKNMSKWGVADVHLQLGWDFYKADDSHVGVYAKAVIPTGTKIDTAFARYAFSSVIGNGKHFELGAGVTAHMNLWSNNDDTLTMYADGYATHMFKATQFRIFDASNMPMSRYAIVKELSYDLSAGDEGDKFGYHHILNALGDINNQFIDTWIDIRGEAVIDFVYNSQQWDIGAGYSFAGQSKEIADLTSSSIETLSQGQLLYGYKGISYEDSLIINATPTSGTAWNALESHAANTAPWNVKTYNDVVASAQGGAYNYGQLVSTTNEEGVSENDVFFLPDLNRSGLMEGQILHTVFAHVGYTWLDCDWMPHYEIFGSAGFSPSSYVTYQKWNIGANFGLSF